MIALWMLYAILSGICVAAACRLLERIAVGTRLPTRGIWVAGIVLMFVIPLGALVPGDTDAASASILEPVAASRAAGVAAGSSWMESERPVPIRTRLARAFDLLESRMGAAADSLAPIDRSLLLLWGLLSAFLTGVVAHAALEGRRLRHGLRRLELQDESVLLTQDVGPSAVGFGEPAILVPNWALDLEKRQIELILRHEREHLAARDPLLLLLTLIAVVVAPWHLPLWSARRRLQLAVEMDCDRRVLREHPDVRRYAELLLLTARRASSTPWASVAVATVVAPLRPRTTHLARRLSAMTHPISRPTLLRSLPLAAAVAALVGVLVVLPTPMDAQVAASDGEDRVLVHLDRVGTIDTTRPMIIVVWGAPGVKVGIGTDPPSLLTDSLRLTNSLPAMTIDVTDGDVHIELRSPGAITMGGTVTGGAAREVSATGRHLVLKKGGTGINSVGMAAAFESLRRRLEERPADN